MKHFIFLLSFIFIFLSNNAQICFAPPSGSPLVVGTNPMSVTSADFNSDGIVDLATANYLSGNISLLLGNGTGNFAAAASFSAGTNPYSVISADFNGDGKADLAVANSSSNDVSVLLGDGAGSFASAVNVLVGAQPMSLISADFNGDGKADLAVPSNGNNNVYVLLGNGTGSFAAPAIFAVASGPRAITSADFNADGKTDLATADFNGNTVTVLLGNGTGGFASAGSVGAGAGPQSITSADFNADGFADLVVANGNNGNLSLLLGNGTGIGAATNLSLAYWNSWGVTSSDFNGDGKADLAIASGVVTISLGDGTGNFPVSLNFGVGTFPVSITCKDFNGDSSLDVAVSNANSDDVSVLLNFPSTTITANATPTVVCSGTSILLTANGGSQYAWSNGSTGAGTSFVANSSATYTVTATDLNGCISTQTVGFVIDNTCADVWPGDANSDGIANNLDILELGLHYTQTGVPRASTGNNWQSYFANNWTGTITNGKNLNHSDCNGDGTIDANDTLAIYNNYGLTHVFKTMQTLTNPELSIVPDQLTVTKGNWGTASIYLGDATDPIYNINGLVFTVDFDNTLIETNSIYIEYVNSFIDGGQNLHFQKPDFTNGKVYTATTHTLSSNVSGYGKIATLHYQISSTLTTDETLIFGVSQSGQSDAFGGLSPLTSGTGTLMAIGASVGIKENAMSGNVLISPNPTNGILNISFNAIPQNTKIEVYNSIGALVLTETMSNKNNTINVSELSSGMYFMKVLEANKIVAVKKVVKE